MRIVWGPELFLGHRVLDSQHEELVALLNELDDVLAGDADRVADVLRRLDAYVLFHFGSEESLMLGLKQPEQLAAHRAEHRHFVEQMVALRELAGNSPDAAIAQLADYLTDWLRNHILVSDRRLAQALNQHAAAEQRSLTR